MWSGDFTSVTWLAASMDPFLLFAGFSVVTSVFANPIAARQGQQIPLGQGLVSTAHGNGGSSQKLNGRFLHITGMITINAREGLKKKKIVILTTRPFF